TTQYARPRPRILRPRPLMILKTTSPPVVRGLGFATWAKPPDAPTRFITGRFPQDLNDVAKSAPSGQKSSLATAGPATGGKWPCRRYWCGGERGEYADRR